MNVLVLFSHPVETSFGAALHEAVVAELRSHGHEVDDCDLYAEGFDPVMTRQQRLDYLNYPINISAVETYVERLRAAEALVIVTPIWNFGFPAILKGYLDKVWAPGVTFELRDGKVAYTLERLKTIVAVTTYGATPMRALLAGNPPKRFINRVLRAQVGLRGRVRFLAHYDMNRSTPETRSAYISKVRAAIARI